MHAIIKREFLVGLLFTFLSTSLAAQHDKPHSVTNLGYQSISQVSLDNGPFSTTSRITNLDLSKFYTVVAFPLDAREKFFGESVYGKIFVRPLLDFSSPMVAIQNKMRADLTGFGAKGEVDGQRKKITINTTVEVLYPHVSNVEKSLAKVRLIIRAALNDSSFIDKRYELLYFQSGSESYREGGLVIGLGIKSDKIANAITGVALRKALDQFYADLNGALNPGRKRIMIFGKVTNANTGEGLSARILINADSVFSVTSAQDGTFNLKVATGQVFHVAITAPHFVNLSEQLDTRAGGQTSERNFKLQPVTVGALVTLENVLFYTGTTDLLEESYPQLDEVVTFLKSNPDVEIKLEGHTDNRGSPRLNLKLSQARVDVIKSYLVSNGIRFQRVTGEGYGDTKPISTNNTEESHRLNRRVEFRIIKN